MKLYMNKKTSATGTNKKAYVVINCKIMSTRPDTKGKLQPCKPVESLSSQPAASQPKQRVTGESGGLVSIYQAANDSADINQDICSSRNVAMHLQLQWKHLKLVNVQGGGNCLFRAVSVNVCGHENQHGELRCAVANHMPKCKPVRNLSGNDTDSLRKCQQRADAMRQDKIWAGEDVILAAADYLPRDIHVFSAAEQAFPLVYSAGITALPPVRIAFKSQGTSNGRGHGHR
jgi:hypothetical protein